MKRLLLTISLAGCWLFGLAQSQDMKSFIDNLMSKMTTEEKIGQLNLLPGGDITTGAVMNSP